MPPIKKSTEKITFKVANTEITMGQTFEVTPKFDADAPNGFQEFGTSKLLSKEVGETHQIPFDETMEIWDTGFDEMSLSNQDVPDEERNALVAIYKKHIQKPYEEHFGKDLSSKDVKNSFWSTYRFDIYNGKTFDTGNLKERLDLFMALKHFKVCEKGEKSYLARTAMYNITNKEKVVGLKDERNFNKATAIGTFMTLLQGDRETLYTVLEWLSFPNVRNSDQQTLTRIVLDYFENDHINVEHFNEAYKLSGSEEGKEEMQAFSIVQKLINKKAITYRRRQYFLNDEELGNSAKDIAKRSLSNAELMQTIMAAYHKIQPSLV